MTLEIITDDSLGPLRHGFFTRRGGASSGVFQGLNCGFGSSDQREVVSINRQRAAEWLGVEPGDLVTLNQVHSPDVAVLSEAPDHPIRADAMVTDRPGLALGILTADCQPVLLADPTQGVIGAAHAGWKGALSGVLDATVQAMVDLGAVRRRIRAVIGPSISLAAYEVGPEFVEVFLLADPENAQFFSGGFEDRSHFDLPAYGMHRLRRAGVGSARWTGQCTYDDPARFFSYRRSVHLKQADYGRLLSAITL